MTIIKDRRIANAILNKIDKEYNLKNNNYIDYNFKYVCSIKNNNELDATFLKTEYKGKKYKVDFVGGCFFPFICEI